MRILQIKFGVNGSVLEAKLDQKKSSKSSCCFDMVPLSTIEAIKKHCESKLKERKNKK